ncbi:MAG: translation initiation factor, aIF-2BI family [Myxococcales bacterium]|nr:translation initiation factor, aIF-2BI family [Myxococcales bacterium]
MSSIDVIDFDEMLSPIRYDHATGVLSLLDQRLLPAEEIWIECRTVVEVAAAIKDMVVRGAPAIGVTAAYGMAIAARRGESLEEAATLLRATRPTAVNLFWAIDMMLKPQRQGGAFPGMIPEELRARSIHTMDVLMCLKIGEFGAPLLPQGGVLTHCNAGALATGGYGTALGVIRTAHKQKRGIHVFADETRPFLQGARLTAWELHKSGIDVTLITDNMAAHMMQRGEIQSVIVGADRIAANGDTANKIGTYGLALLARAHDLPFYVAAPLSTVDLATPTGRQIPIEERSAREVTHVGDKQLAPDGIKVRNPAFDVTPAGLITAIITNVGVARAPYEPALAALARTMPGPLL